MKTSVFLNKTQFERNVDFNQVVNAIKLGRFQDRVFCLSGVMSISGNKKKLLIPTGLIMLSFDMIQDSQFDMIFHEISKMTTTYCCFRNHLGTGIVVMVRTDSLESHHKAAYQQVVETYESYLNLKVSTTNTDIFTLCPISYDPNIYFNPDSTLFEIEVKTRNNAISEAQKQELHREIFEDRVKYTEQRVTLTEKTWNEFFGTLANNCFEEGIPLVSTLEFVMQDYGLDSIKKGIITRVYKKLSVRKVSVKDSVFSFHFKNYENYNESIEADEIMYFEFLVHRSINLGIPFYFSDKRVASKLKINRTRREKIVEKFVNMGFLHTFLKKVEESDRFPTTHYQLIPQNLPVAAEELMIDPTNFLKTVMPLLYQKNKVNIGYSPKA